MTIIPPIILLHGPTASGKSALAVNVAKQNDAVIINADSMQVYRDIPIVSAQPTADERQDVEHHLYGHIDASTHYSVAAWLDEVIPLIHQIRSEHRTPLLVGGTGMYIKALVEGISPIPDIPLNIRHEARELYESVGASAFHQLLAEKDPEIANRLPEGDTQRMLRAYEVALHTGSPLSHWQKQPSVPHFDRQAFQGYFLHPERQAIYDRCNERFLEMINNGLIEEVQQLYSRDLPPTLPAMKAHGVSEIIHHLNGAMTRDEAITHAQTQTRRYVKRQLTWQRNQFPDFTIIEKPDGDLLLPFR